MAGIKHKKHNNIPSWDQATLDAVIALGGPGNVPPGTTINDIVLSQDYNSDHIAPAGTPVGYVPTVADTDGNLTFQAPGGGGGGISGSGVANQVAYWSSTTALTSNAGFTYDGATVKYKSDTGANPITLGKNASANAYSTISWNNVLADPGYLGMTAGSASDTRIYYNASEHYFRNMSSQFSAVITTDARLGVGVATPGTGFPYLNGRAHVQVNSSDTASIIMENTGSGAATFVAKGGYEGDMVLQHSNASSGQQAFYFRVRNGLFDILNLSDNLSAINNYTYTVRYDGRWASGYGGNSDGTSKNKDNMSAAVNIGNAIGAARALQVDQGGGGTPEVARFSAPGGNPYITIGNGQTTTTGSYILLDQGSGTLQINNHTLPISSTTGGIAINNGQVGIGTTTPGAGKYLDIQINTTGGGTGMHIQNVNAGGYSELIFDNDSPGFGSGGNFVFGYGGTATPNPDQCYFYNRRPGDMLFGTNNTTRMTVGGSNGQVNITTVDNSFNNSLIVQNTSTGSNAYAGIAVKDGFGNIGAMQMIPPNFGAPSLANTMLFVSQGQQRLGFVANSSGIASAPQELYFATLSGRQNAIHVIPTGSADYIGLNTSGPTQVLDVNGGGRVRGLAGTGTRMVPAASDGTLGSATVPTGTVTSVSVTTANGVSGSVATATTTPAISLTLGAITPTSVAASGTVTGSNLSGTNTGDQTSVTGNAGTATALATARTIAATGDAAWSVSFNGSANATSGLTLATTGVTAGSYTNANVTVDAKGRITAASNGAAAGSTTTYINTTKHDQSPASGSYGALGGAIDGTNAVFTTSAGVYVTGSLQVYLNGQELTQGASYDWVETTPASGTFTFNTAPASGSIIQARYITAQTVTGSVTPIRVVTASGAVAVATSDQTVVINKTIGAATAVSLPPGAVTGQTFRIKDGKGDANTNNITITPASGLIDGAATYTISTNKASVTVQFDGTNYWIL